MYFYETSQQIRNVPVTLAEGYAVTFAYVTLRERKENFPKNVRRTLPANVIVT